MHHSFHLCIEVCTQKRGRRDIRYKDILSDEYVSQEPTQRCGDELRDVDYNKEITEEKIGLQENYIEDLKKNKDKL